MRSLDFIPLFFTSASSRNLIFIEIWYYLTDLHHFSYQTNILVKILDACGFGRLNTQDSYTTETLSLEHKSLAKASDRHRKLVGAAGTARFPFIGKPSPIHEFHRPSHFFGANRDSVLKNAVASRSSHPSSSCQSPTASWLLEERMSTRGGISIPSIFKTLHFACESNRMPLD